MHNDINTTYLHGNVDEVIISFYNLANLARKEGLLALEDLLEEAGNAPLLVKIGIQLVVDGTDPALITEIIRNLINSGDIETEEQRKEAEIILTGILSIQEGQNPRVIMMRMASCLGFEAYMKFGMNGNAVLEANSEFMFGKKIEKKERRKMLSREEVDSLLSGGAAEECVSEGLVPCESETPLQYKNKITDLALAAMTELVNYSQDRSEIIGMPVDILKFASALHVLPAQVFCEALNNHLLSPEIVAAYKNDSNSFDTHVRDANYFVDIMMGGDGAEYR